MEAVLSLPDVSGFLLLYPSGEAVPMQLRPWLPNSP